MVQETGRSLSHGALLSWSNFRPDGRLQPQPQVRCNKLTDLSSSLSTSSTHSSPSGPKEGAWPVARVYLRTNDAATGDMTSSCGSGSLRSRTSRGVGRGWGNCRPFPGGHAHTRSLGNGGRALQRLTDLLFVLYKRLKQNPPLGPTPPSPSFANWKCQHLTQLSFTIRHCRPSSSTLAPALPRAAPLLVPLHCGQADS